MKKKIIGYIVSVSVIFVFMVFANYEKKVDRNSDKSEEILKLNEADVNVIAFSSPHCSACKDQAEIIGNLQSEITDGAVFEYVDVTKQRSVADHYEVIVVPTLVITRHGIVVERFSGTKSETDIKKVIERELGQKHCFDGTLC